MQIDTVPFEVYICREHSIFSYVWCVFAENIPAGQQAPRMMQRLARSIVLEGGTTRFACRVEGKPEPQIQW